MPKKGNGEETLVNRKRRLGRVRISHHPLQDPAFRHPRHYLEVPIRPLPSHPFPQPFLLHPFLIAQPAQTSLYLHLLVSERVPYPRRLISKSGRLAVQPNRPHPDKRLTTVVSAAQATATFSLKAVHPSKLSPTPRVACSVKLYHHVTHNLRR
jgi:hypothetical protein